ncbi:MAG TPA: radical SAM family heme chaperone HemW [Trueperaceae bacterium]|nr:radical SAM family heme chaperone HemW [Trueperaceae bacterium]
MPVSSLYVHVPFCPSVCPYCDFHKMLRHEGLAARYVARLAQELAALAEEHGGPLETLYLGGGTPSHLRDDELERVFAALAGFGGPARLETTLEADPLTFDAERLTRFASLGVTRLSIGLQSTQDHVLAFLGRLHDGAQGLAAVEAALSSGLRVNVDVMTSIAGQDLELDLSRVVAAGARHVSVYSLTVEPHTPFALRGVTVDEDLDAAAFDLTATVLARAGLRRYEVSNHAVPGEESRHNLVYWRGGHYLGAGPSASSHLPGGDGFGVRLKNPPLKGWLRGDPPEADVLTADDVVLERLMTGLRTVEGVDLAGLEASTGYAVEYGAARWLDDCLAHGLLTLEGRRLTATPAGLTRLDAVLRAFVATRSPATAAA